MNYYKLVAETDDVQKYELTYSQFDVAFNKYESIILDDKCIRAELWLYAENPKTFIYNGELFDEYDRNGNYIKTVDLMPTIKRTGDALKQRMSNMRAYMMKKYQLQLSSEVAAQITAKCDEIINLIITELEKQGVPND